MFGPSKCDTILATGSDQSPSRIGLGMAHKPTPTSDEEGSEAMQTLSGSDDDDDEQINDRSNDQTNAQASSIPVGNSLEQILETEGITLSVERSVQLCELLYAMQEQHSTAHMAQVVFAMMLKGCEAVVTGLGAARTTPRTRRDLAQHGRNWSDRVSQNSQRSTGCTVEAKAVVDGARDVIPPYAFPAAFGRQQGASVDITHSNTDDTACEAVLLTLIGGLSYGGFHNVSMTLRVIETAIRDLDSGTLRLWMMLSNIRKWMVCHYINEPSSLHSSHEQLKYDLEARVQEANRVTEALRAAEAALRSRSQSMSENEAMRRAVSLVRAAVMRQGPAMAPTSSPWTENALAELEAIIANPVGANARDNGHGLSDPALATAFWANMTQVVRLLKVVLDACEFATITNFQDMTAVESGVALAECASGVITSLMNRRRDGAFLSLTIDEEKKEQWQQPHAHPHGARGRGPDQCRDSNLHRRRNQRGWGLAPRSVHAQTLGRSIYALDLGHDPIRAPVPRGPTGFVTEGPVENWRIGQYVSAAEARREGLATTAVSPWDGMTQQLKNSLQGVARGLTRFSSPFRGSGAFADAFKYAAEVFAESSRIEPLRAVIFDVASADVGCMTARITDSVVLQMLPPIVTEIFRQCPSSWGSHIVVRLLVCKRPRPSHPCTH